MTCVNPSFQTLTKKHCVFLWIRKNYRLQDIQLSKNGLGA